MYTRCCAGGNWSGWNLLSSPIKVGALSPGLLALASQQSPRNSVQPSTMRWSAGDKVLILLPVLTPLSVLTSNEPVRPWWLMYLYQLRSVRFASLYRSGIGSADLQELDLRHRGLWPNGSLKDALQLLPRLLYQAVLCMSTDRRRPWNALIHTCCCCLRLFNAPMACSPSGWSKPPSYSNAFRKLLKYLTAYVVGPIWSTNIAAILTKYQHGPRPPFIFFSV